MTENLVSGKKFRILTDAINDVWERISFWTKASDVFYDDGSSVEDNKPTNLLKRNVNYAVGEMVYEPSAPSWCVLVCTRTGTTSSIVPSEYSDITEAGASITDGTATFVAYDMRPVTTLPSNVNANYYVPSMDSANNIDSYLTAPNGVKFYFDCKNGRYGYNTSPDLGLDTYRMFSSSHAVKLVSGIVFDSYPYIYYISPEEYPNYEEFTTDNFIITLSAINVSIKKGTYIQPATNKIDFVKEYSVYTHEFLCYVANTGTSLVSTGTYDLWLVF